jgi:hypothetical protein
VRKLRRSIGELLYAFPGVSVLYLDITPLIIPEVAQPLAKRLAMANLQNRYRRSDNQVEEPWAVAPRAASGNAAAGPPVMNSRRFISITGRVLINRRR